MTEHITLPRDFFFGAALSGPQTEGAWRSFGKIESIWDTWSNLDLGAFYNRVGSYGGNDMSRRAREDFGLFARLGFAGACARRRRVPHGTDNGRGA